MFQSRSRSKPHCPFQGRKLFFIFYGLIFIIEVIRDVYNEAVSSSCSSQKRLHHMSHVFIQIKLCNVTAVNDSAFVFTLEDHLLDASSSLNVLSMLCNA